MGIVMQVAVGLISESDEQEKQLGFHPPDTRWSGRLVQVAFLTAGAAFSIYEGNRAACLFIRIIWVGVTGGTIFGGRRGTWRRGITTVMIFIT